MKTFLERIAEIQSLANLKKNAKNPHFKSDYLDLPGLISALTPLLHERGLIMTQSPATEAGQFGIRTVIQMQRVEVDEDGDPVTGPHNPVFIAGFWPVSLVPDAQKVMGGSTYARRYSILACLGLAAEDDDGESAVGRGGMRRL